MLSLLSLPRASQHSDQDGTKSTHAVAKLLEEGQPVQPHHKVSLETSSWMASKGGGLGQRMYR